MIGRITVILLLFASSCFGQTRGHGFFWGQSSAVSSGPDTLELTYWDDFVLLHISGTGITETGSGVSEWQDRSGNGNHSTQTTDTNRPTVDGSGNVVFDGVNDYLDVSFPLGSATDSAFTIFVAYERTGSSTGIEKIFDFTDGAEATGRFHALWFYNDGGNPTDSLRFLARTKGPVDATMYDTIAVNQNTQYLSVIASSETVGTDLYLNSTQYGSTQSDGDWYGTSTGSDILGAIRTSDSQFFEGKILFFGIVGKKMTPSEIATTESELNSFFTIY